MILDDQNRYADSQAVSGAGATVSTDVVDHSADRNIGHGEPMVAMITIEVAADDGDGDETYTVQLQTDTVVGFGSPTNVGGVLTIPRGTAAGTIYGLPVPPGTETERFTRLNWTLGGTTPSVTYSSYLVPQSFMKKHATYPDAVDFGT